MRHWILASHGTLAHGLRDAIGIILGTRTDVISVACHVEGAAPPADAIAAAVARVPEQQGVVIVTDLIGGSVDREARVVAAADPQRFRVLGGMSLPLMLTLLSLSEGVDDVDALVATALGELDGAVLAPTTPALDTF